MFYIHFTELRINYLNYLITRGPVGRLSERRGKPVVELKSLGNLKGVPKEFIPDLSSSNRSILLQYTPKGTYWSNRVRQIQALQIEQQKLLSTWKSIYKNSPRYIEYPLHLPGTNHFDKAFFDKLVPNLNPIPIEAENSINKPKSRSKNEVLAYDIITDMGYEAKQEARLNLPFIDSFNAFFPDLSIYVPEIERTIFSELDGAVDNPRYLRHSIERQSNYFTQGFDEFKDVFFYRINSPYTFDATLFRNLFYITVEQTAENIIHQIFG